MEVLCQGEEIKKLIPQREPIVQVDTLFYKKESEACCGLTILPDNIFCQQGHFTEPGLIEHIAQSSAAMSGYSFFRNNQPAPLGFIAEIKKMNIYFCPKIGEKLRTRLTIVSEVENMSLVKAETCVDDKLVAEGQMKIFIKQ